MILSGARKDILRTEAQNPATDDHGYSVESLTLFSNSAYVFLVCCAYGTNMCQRYGNYDYEVTTSDEAFLVATYVLSFFLTFISIISNCCNMKSILDVFSMMGLEGNTLLTFS